MLLDEAVLPPSMGTDAIALRDFSVFSARGTPVSLAELSEAKEQLSLTGVLCESVGASACAGDRVCSSALVRWYVDYTAAPVIIAQSLCCTFALAADDGAAAVSYVGWWRPLVRSVNLAARVLRAVREKESRVWEVAGGGHTPQELVDEWPFVRGQLRVLGYPRVKRPNDGEQAPEEARTEPAETRATRGGERAAETRGQKRPRGGEDAGRFDPALAPSERLVVQQRCVPRAWEIGAPCLTTVWLPCGCR